MRRIGCHRSANAARRGAAASSTTACARQVLDVLRDPAPLQAVLQRRERLAAMLRPFSGASAVSGATFPDAIRVRRNVALPTHAASRALS